MQEGRVGVPGRPRQGLEVEGHHRRTPLREDRVVRPRPQFRETRQAVPDGIQGGDVRGGQKSVLVESQPPQAQVPVQGTSLSGFQWVRVGVRSTPVDGYRTRTSMLGGSACRTERRDPDIGVLEDLID